jgi:predicted RNA binding protein YcfA (HicA-like mRNA interferase family)
MKLPLLTCKQVLSTLQRIGFIERSRKGSHVKMRHADGRIIVFPCHKEIDPYTLKGSLKDADIDITLFLKHLK